MEVKGQKSRLYGTRGNKVRRVNVPKTRILEEENGLKAILKKISLRIF